MRPLNLLYEKCVTSELELIVEEKNINSESNYYISGPYLMYGAPNKNKRQYAESEMITEVARYTKEFIDRNRALGELNHPPESTDVDLKNACHSVVSLEQREGNFFHGKSKILSTPSGLIVRTLLQDGIQLGISSRALGRLVPKDGINIVEGLRLLALDVVHEPSVTNAMLESITENRQFIIDEGGKVIELACDSLECKLDAIPKKDVSGYLAESFANFINALKA
tara:strand:+ start:3398 stop:4072 length:675 start_codon:yes stop_codon:yes gene_type:complete